MTIGLLMANTSRYRLTWRANPATSMVIGWNQVSGSNPTVYYGTTDYGTNWSAYPFSRTPDRSVSHKGMNNRFVRLSNLQPNTAYYFVIRDSQGTSQRFWFKTCPNTASERLSFIAGGDSRNNRTPRRNANKLVAKLRPHAVFFGGDMTNANTSSEWQDWFDDWQYTIGTDGRMIPIVAARGNHEGSNSDIVNLFDVPSSSVYYALNFGGNLIRSYTLNTETSISGSQTSWLNNDLQANNNVVWKMAQYHKPMRPHVSSKSEGNSQYSNWAQLFYDYKVSLVVECDAHTVKSTWPVRPSSVFGSDEGFIRDDANGTVYVGEGCWGAPLRSNNDSKAWTRNSGMFNQFKWIFVDQNRIECRTIRVDNADQVGTVNDADIFTAPSNLNIWNPSNGAVINITKASSNQAPSISLTNPSNGASFSSGARVNLSATASDADGSVTKVEFFVDGNLVATDYSAPYSTNQTIGNGSHTAWAKAFDNSGNQTSSNQNSFTVGSFSQTVNVRIASGNDDVEEAPDGDVYTNSSDIELIYDGYNGGDQTVGLRFTNVQIPQGASITNAYIQFAADESNSGSTTLNIYGHYTGNAAAFSTSNGNVSSRNRTSSRTVWSPVSWSSGQQGSGQRTPEMKSVLQEIVNHSGWNAGNAMAFIIEGTGERTAESYEGSSSKAPLLHVAYTVGGQAANQDPTVLLTAPSNGTNYQSLGAITLSASALDADGSINRVEFFVNGVRTYTDYTSPYRVTWNISNYGTHTIQARAFDNEGASALSGVSRITATQPNAQTFTFEKRVSSSYDDAEESESGSMYRTSSDLELVYDSWRSNGNQQIGIRFRNVTIPQGAIITKAYIQFTADESHSGSTVLTIYGEDTNNASSYSSSSNNISSRSKTSARATWLPASWSTGQAASAQRTPELKSLVQEIVNRGGWQDGNNMAFIINGVGKRVAESYNGSSTKAPLLHIEYQTGATARTQATNYDFFNPSTWDASSAAVKLYPNPMKKELTVALLHDQEAQEIEIVDSKGAVVFKTAKVSQTTQLDLAHLAKGVYVVRVKTAQGEFKELFLKQ